MKKKNFVSSKDKKDWRNFIKNMDKLAPKKVDLYQEKKELKKIPKLDLHGFSLEEANKLTEKFVINSFNSGYKKILIITGKGLRSKSHNNPYISEKLSILKYSVPEYINNNHSLINKINKIEEANLTDGGEGAIYIFLKKNY